MIKNLINNWQKTDQKIGQTDQKLINKTDLTSGAVYKCQCGLYNISYHGDNDKDLNIRSGEHIDGSSLIRHKVTTTSNSAGCNHLLHSIYLPSFNSISILAHEIEKYLLEIKESLLIVKDKLSVNGNITLHLRAFLTKSPNEL